MKNNNLMKILIIIIIILTLGIVGVSARLISLEKNNQDQNTSENLKENDEKLDPPRDKPIKDEPIIEKDPVVEVPDENNSPKDDKVIIIPKYISKEEANEIAIAKIGKDVTLDEIEFERDSNPPKYEIEMFDNEYEYDIEIQAITGEVLKFEMKGFEDKELKKDPIIKVKYITKDEAIEIGLKKLGSEAVLIDIESDLDDNPPKYELEFVLGKYEYEIEIHAITGAIIDFEKD